MSNFQRFDLVSVGNPPMDAVFVRDAGNGLCVVQDVRSGEFVSVPITALTRLGNQYPIRKVGAYVNVETSNLQRQNRVDVAGMAFMQALQKLFKDVPALFDRSVHGDGAWEPGDRSAIHIETQQEPNGTKTCIYVDAPALPPKPVQTGAVPA